MKESKITQTSRKSLESADFAIHTLKVSTSRTRPQYHTFHSNKSVKNARTDKLQFSRIKLKPFVHCLFFNNAKTFLNSVLKFVREISTTLYRLPVLAADAPTVFEGVDMSSKRMVWLSSVSSYMPRSLHGGVFSKPSQSCNSIPARYIRHCVNRQRDLKHHSFGFC